MDLAYDEWADLELVDVVAEAALQQQRAEARERDAVCAELVLVEAQEALQEQVALLRTPAEVDDAIAECLERFQVPPERETSFLAGARLRLAEVKEEAELDLRRELATSTSVPMINSVAARAEQLLGRVESGVREQIDLARIRRAQFLEMELETRWSRPFVGPLPAHSRAARRYELELGADHPKVKDFVKEERRYTAALVADFEVRLGRLQALTRKLTLQREDARARSVREDLDEKLSAVASDVREVISSAIQQIGPDNPTVTRRALEMLSTDEHATVYSLHADDTAAQLRVELEQAGTSPEAGDRRRDLAATLRALLHILSPLHPLQEQWRAEFAAELAALPPYHAPSTDANTAPPPADIVTLGVTVADPDGQDADLAMPPGYEFVVGLDCEDVGSRSARGLGFM